MEQLKLVLLPLSLGLASCAAVAQHTARPSVEHYQREGSRAPFSPAVRAGDNVYVSGMIGARPDGTFPDGIEAQARQAMDNIKMALGMAGLGFGDVVKCTVMLENIDDWPAFNRIYVTYFEPGRLPARSAFGVDGLALGSLVEIECQAYAPEPRR